MTDESLRDLLASQYGIHADIIRQFREGAGSSTYFVDSGQGRYVLKFPAKSGMNQPELEPPLCEYLNKRGIPACRFLPNRQGAILSTDPKRGTVHLQEYYEGKTFGLNAAPDWLLPESARMLGRIHTALRDYRGLPVGIGPSFFREMTPERAEASYRRSLRIAEECAQRETAAELRSRISLLKRLPKYRFDLSALTCANTHGDYYISQLICGGRSIRAVVDWTTACVHPVVWELIRSYMYASPRSAAGSIAMDEFGDYVAAYLENAPLKPEDIRAMVPLFAYQSAVCDYYGQYFASAADNRHIYLHQAAFTTKLLGWLEEHGEALEGELERRFIRAL